jgi:hypothetical protein
MYDVCIGMDLNARRKLYCCVKEPMSDDSDAYTYMHARAL